MSKGSSVFKKAIILSSVAHYVPKIYSNVLVRGLVPLPFSTLKTIKEEGVSDLHKKMLGDFLFRVFQSSGPVLTKIGQILAARDDILPLEVAGRLNKLYKENEPVSIIKVVKILKKAKFTQELIDSVVDRPLGVGSIGQVHKAKDKNGEDLIIKILRPGVKRRINGDMRALKGIISIVGKIVKDNNSTLFIASKALDDLGQAFSKECDLTNEAKNIEAFRKRFSKNKQVYIPKVYKDLSTKDVLVMEEVKGESLDDFRKRGGDKDVAGVYLKEVLTQIFDDGLFHADPHMGNIIVMEDGRLGLIDLGLVGEFEKKERRYVAKAIKAFWSKDVDSVIKALINFGQLPPDWDFEAFKEDVIKVVKVNKASVVDGIKGEGDSHIENFVNQLFRVAYEHRLYLPPSTTLLIKTLVTVEGVARTIDSEINLVSVAVPVILKSLTPKWMRIFS